MSGLDDFSTNRINSYKTVNPCRMRQPNTWSMQKLIRLLAFFVLFGIGMAALAISILCDDLTVYFQNKQDLARAEKELEDIRQLVSTHDSLLHQLDRDPNMLKRIAPAVIGTGEEDPNVVYPDVGIEEYIAAKIALREHNQAEFHIPEMPEWLTRCRNPRQRMGLFFSGSVLILVSFTCFGLAHSHGSVNGSGE